MKTLLNEVTALSPDLADIVYASLSWSGSSRLVNTYKTASAEDVKGYTYLASLASKVSNEALRPTTELVIDLLTTPPVAHVPNPEQVARAIKCGETKESIAASVIDNHNAAMARFDKQEKMIANNLTDIQITLESAFNKKITHINLPTNLEEAMASKINTKLMARKTRLLDNIYQDLYADEAEVELTAINAYIKQKAA